MITHLNVGTLTRYIQSMKPCPLCQRSYRNLGQHFRWKHDLSLKQYVQQDPPLCEVCSGPIEYPQSRTTAAYVLERRFCSLECRSEAKSGENHPRFKGGHLGNHGYRIVSVRGRPILEHRHVMQEHLGRELETDEHVHHINGDRLDNRTENLELMSSSEHTRLHGGWQVRDERRPRGERHGCAKLSEQDVRTIRVKYALGGVTQKQLGSEYGVSHTTISMIVTNHIWKHLFN